MSKSKILIQFDGDSQCSTFDSVVAIDAGVEQLFRHAGITGANVEGLVHGAIFTRGVENLRSTAIFVGGSDVAAAEAIVSKIEKTFFGPLRVSVMADPNGSNTTAAAAVLSAEKHVDWLNKTIVIHGGTGPVGQRIAQIIGRQVASLETNSRIRIVSRSLERASQTCSQLANRCGIDCFEPFAASQSSAHQPALSNSQVIFACGAAGVELVGSGWLDSSQAPVLAVDLNAVPPAGLHGIDVLDRGQLRGSTVCYGAIGVGTLKMKIHKSCLKSLFDSNDRMLLVDEIYAIGKQLA